MYFLNSQPTQVRNLLFKFSCHFSQSPAEKRTRGAAINTVRHWVPHSPPMDGVVREFARQMLRKLQLRSSESRSHAPHKDVEDPEGDVKMNGNGNGDDNGNGDSTTTPPRSTEPPRERVEGQDMEDGQLPSEDLMHTPYLPERIELPAQKSQVLQHVELLFALCVKVPDFLDE